MNAIVEAWFLGGANAVSLVNILSGQTNPSGRLAETFPLCIEHTPHFGTFPAKEDQINYNGDIINLGYRYYDTHKYPVRYPFGYGLSYTTFEYSNLILDKKELNEDELLTIQLDITNTGPQTGKEVVQIYVRDLESYLPRPNKELVAFKKIELEPLETKRVTFTLSKSAFSVYSELVHEFRVEEGAFDIIVAKNANDEVLSDKVYVTSNTPFPIHLTLEHPLKNFFIHRSENTNKLLNQYRDFPWYEIEEPALRVLKRVKREFNISNQEFENLLSKLLSN